MFEGSKEPLIPTVTFLIRVIRNVFFGILLITFSLFVGMCGYHYYEGMSWTDAFVNASMILSGMGPLTTLVTKGGKLFAGCYALFSGLFFIAIIGVMYAPIFHRFLHKFHLDVELKQKEKNRLHKTESKIN